MKLMILLYSLVVGQAYSYVKAYTLSRETYGDCRRCGKKLTFEDFLYSYYEQHLIEPLYCKNCIKKRPLELTAVEGKHITQSQDEGRLLMGNESDWDFDNDDELSCTVDGWHFRVRRCSRQLYACSPTDRSEIRTDLHFSIVRLTPSKDCAYKVILEGDDGSYLELDTQKPLFGLKPGEHGVTFKDNDERVQEELEKTDEPNEESFSNYLTIYLKRVLQIIAEEESYQQQ